jgi:hypothetical protein
VPPVVSRVTEIFGRVRVESAELVGHDRASCQPRAWVRQSR